MERPSVLIVDDQPLVATLIETAFEDAGFETCVVFGGAAAVGQLEIDGGRLCAVVTDIRMDGDLSGWAVATEARSRFPALPVIYVTGDSAAEWSTYGVPESVLIQKPFVGQQVVAAVMALMNKPTAAGASA